MSIFASKTKSEPLPIPFDSPHTIVVRKMTGREVERAQEAHAIGVSSGRSRLWSQTFKQLLEKGVAGQAELQAVLRDPLTGYDRFSVARAGLLAWSYPEPIKAQPAKAAVPAVGDTPAQPATEAYDPIEDLDDETVEFIAREVMRLTKPGLFQTLEQAESAQKNG